MPDQLSKPVHVTIWQIFVIMCQKRASHGIHAASEGNKSLNCNLSSIWFTLSCELLHYICGPPQEAAEHQNKASQIPRSLATSRNSKNNRMYFPSLKITLLLSFWRQVAGGCIPENSLKLFSVVLVEDALLKHSLQSNLCFDNTPQS